MSQSGRTVEPTAEIQRPEPGAGGEGEQPSSDGAAAAAVSEPRALGRYRLRYRVATGGMASVYLAQLASERGFRKWVALKTIHPHIATNAKFVQMFFNEARLAARIDHPNVCSVFDFGEADGTYYLAMEYLHGEALSSVLRRAWRKDGGVPYEVAARIVADVARGLHAAHELKTSDGTNAGVVHRDVSPQNVFVLYNGVTKIVDFGIARSREHEGEHTQAGELKGKIAYMAPEQVQHGELDRRADVWSLGVVLWELSAGARLFKRANDAQSLLAIISGDIKKPSAVRAGYPAALEAVVLRALAVDPATRYATAAEFARALEAFIVQHGTPASATEVADFMNGLFADQRALREGLLYREDASDAAAASSGPESGVVSSSIFRGMTLPPPPGPRVEIQITGGSRAEGTPVGDRAGSESGERVNPARVVEGTPSGSVPRPRVASTTPLGASAPSGTPSVTPPPSVVPPSVAPSLAPPMPSIDEGAEHDVVLPRPAAVPAALLPAGESGNHPSVEVDLAFDGAAADNTARAAAAAAAARRQRLTIGLGVAGAVIVSLAVGVGVGRQTSQPASQVLASPAGAVAAASGAREAPPRASPSEVVPGPAPSAPQPVAVAAGTSAGPAAAGAAANTPAATDPARDAGIHPVTPTASAQGTPHAPPAPRVGSTAGGAGFLNLFAVPSAEVFEGRRSLGFTPLAGRAMPAGAHTLRLVPTGGQPPRTLTVFITPGATAAHSVRWR